MDKEFVSFPKIPRLSRQITITEKIDGTNGLIYIEFGQLAGVGSRSRWITPQDDNFGFARWAEGHEEELVTKLGDGLHHGEWWGSGIQRGYGLAKGEKRFSLFNTAKFGDVLSEEASEGEILVVPTLYQGAFDTSVVEYILEGMREAGSHAAPGFMNPEGIILWHSAARLYFKATIEGDDEPKGVRR